MRNVRSAATVAGLALFSALAFVAFPFGSRSAAQDATLRKEKVSVFMAGAPPVEEIKGVYLASEGAGFWFEADVKGEAKDPVKHKLFIPWTSVRYLLKGEK